MATLPKTTSGQPLTSDFDAVLFDWGGTLSLWADVVPAEMWRAGARAIRPADHDELARMLLVVENEFWQVAHEGGAASGTTHQMVAETIRRLGYDHSEDEVGACVAAYLSAWEATFAHADDAAEVLTELRASGVRTGLLSNTHWPRALHDAALERDGLLHLLDACVYSSELEVMKPHPLAFQALLDAVGVADPSRAVFVGDRPRDDISGAQAAGMRTVLIGGRPVPGYDVTPDATIEKLSELPGLLRAWSG